MFFVSGLGGGEGAGDIAVPLPSINAAVVGAAVKQFAVGGGVETVQQVGGLGPRFAGPLA